MTNQDDEFDWEAIRLSIADISAEELIEKAWNSDASNSAANFASRRALRAFAKESPQLSQKIADLERGVSERLAIRIHGSLITDHSANASKLAEFLKKSSKAFNEIAKSVNGLVRIKDRILVTAPIAGSVRVIFTVEKDRRVQRDLPLDDVLTIHENAMKMLVGVWLQAEDFESDVLNATINTLNGQARQSVRSLTQMLTKSGWDVDGEYMDRSGEVVPIAISKFGLKRVLDITANSSTAEEEIKATGYVDGWIWSKQVMKFNRTVGGPIDAYVPEPLSQTVAEWNAKHESAVNITLNMLTTFPMGDNEYSRKSYTLLSLEPSMEQGSLNDI